MEYKYKVSFVEDGKSFVVETNDWDYAWELWNSKAGAVLEQKVQNS